MVSPTGSILAKYGWMTLTKIFGVL